MSALDYNVCALIKKIKEAALSREKTEHAKPSVNRGEL